MLRTLIATLLVALLASAAATAAGLDANVIAVNHTTGSQTAEVVLAIPKAVENAAVIGNADFGLRITMTYVSVNNDVETFDSGRFPVTDTAVIGQLDSKTVAVVTTITFDGPVPGTNPSFSATAELLHPGSG
jgi:hypothetical protein